MFEQRPAAPRRRNRPVWVRLDGIYRQLNFPPRRLDDSGALDTRGEVPGALHAWLRTTTGEWLGLASFVVPYHGLDPARGLQLVDQLVPADVLRPRAYGSSRVR